MGGPLLRPRYVICSACKDIITRLLDKREWTRLGSKSGASEVKQHKWFAKINWGLLRNTQPPVSTCTRAQFLVLWPPYSPDLASDAHTVTMCAVTLRLYWVR